MKEYYFYIILKNFFLIFSKRMTYITLFQLTFFFLSVLIFFVCFFILYIFIYKKSLNYSLIFFSWRKILVNFSVFDFPKGYFSKRISPIRYNGVRRPTLKSLYRINARFFSSQGRQAKWDNIYKNLIDVISDIKVASMQHNVLCPHLWALENIIVKVLDQKKILEKTFYKKRLPSLIFVEKEWNSFYKDRVEDWLFPWQIYMPTSLGSLLNKSCIECLIYQNVVKKIHSFDEYFLFIKPFLQYCLSLLKSNPLLLQNFVDYNNRIYDSDTLILKKEREKKKQKLVGDPLRVCLHSIMKVLLYESTCYDTIELYDQISKLMKKHHVIRLNQESRLRFLDNYLRLINKPMIVTPVEWEISPKGDICNGGYFCAHNTLYNSMDLSTICNFAFSKEYCNVINQLQSMSFNISISQLDFVVKYWIEFYSESIKVGIKNISLNKNKKKASLFLEKKLGKISLQFFSFIIQLSILNGLNIVLPKSKYLTIYLPIHIDRVGRMYNSGIFNLTTSKFFRQIITFSKKQMQKCKLMTFRSPKRRIVEDLFLIKNKVILLRNINPLYGSKDWLSLEYYKMLLEKREGIIFLDATASMLQIYSLLFGDLDMAIKANLFEEKFDPIMSLWSLWIFSPIEVVILENWAELRNNRKYLKQIIMLKIYGASDFGIQEAFFILMEELDIERYSLLTSKERKELKKIIIILSNKIQQTFPLLFSLKTIVENRKSESLISILWQGNICTYGKFKLKQCTLDFTNSFCNKSNNNNDNVHKRNRISFEMINSEKIDIRRTNRTILSTLIQSIDAAVAVNVRKLMLERYQINIYSIHDCFGCDIGYSHLLKEVYKEVLFDIVFDKKLEQFFVIDGINFSDLQAKIDSNKSNCGWKNLRACISMHCLKLE